MVVFVYFYLIFIFYLCTMCLHTRLVYHRGDVFFFSYIDQRRSLSWTRPARGVLIQIQTAKLSCWPKICLNITYTITGYLISMSLKRCEKVGFLRYSRSAFAQWIDRVARRRSPLVSLLTEFRKQADSHEA